MNFLKKVIDFFSVPEVDTQDNHKLHTDILREYDIRGIFGKTLFTKDAYDIGRAFGTLMIRKNLKKICVAQDCRNSSNILAKHLIDGLIRSGIEAISIGICHTPMMYYAVNSLCLDGGIMITGSHNTPDYNGFKIVIGNDPFYGNDIVSLGNMIREKDFIDGNGREILLNKIFANYIKQIIDGFEFSNDIKVAWDIGNGATSNVIKAITAMIPGKHHILFEEMDGDFPNRMPDPTIAKNIEYLSKFVLYNNFDIGFAFDSDGDRLSVVDSTGKMLHSDQVFEVLSSDFLRKNPGARVIADAKCCNRLFDSIKKLGGIAIMEKTGHSFIKSAMKASGALIAGEMSGHFFFKDRWLGFDDGVYAALRCLEILNWNNDAFNNLEYGFVTPEIRIPCDDSKKFEIINQIKVKLKSVKSDIVEIDGIRINEEIGWWILRASNTQNAISLRIESYTENDMRKLKEEIASYLIEHISNVGDFLENE